MLKIIKNLVLVLTIFLFKIMPSIKVFVNDYFLLRKVINNFSLLKHLTYIYYLLWFKKNYIKIQVIIDFHNKINIMA